MWFGYNLLVRPNILIMRHHSPSSQPELHSFTHLVVAVGLNVEVFLHADLTDTSVTWPDCIGVKSQTLYHHYSAGGKLRGKSWSNKEKYTSSLWNLWIKTEKSHTVNQSKNVKLNAGFKPGRYHKKATESVLKCTMTVPDGLQLSYSPQRLIIDAWMMI